MNFYVIFRSIAYLLLILAVAMAAAVGVGSVIHVDTPHQNEVALNSWIICIAITFSSVVTLFLAARFFKNNPDSPMLRKEAIAIAGIAWLVCGLHAALPYIFCQTGLSFAQSIFEALSGLTTTGSTVISDLEKIPKTLLIWRSLTEWLGGLGIVMIFVLLQSRDGASGKMMFGAESSLPMSDLKFSNFRKAQRSLWTLYISLTVICAVGYLILGNMNAFQAINYAMTTTATGGFGTENDSFNSFDTGAKIWAILFMLICGISLFLYLLLIKRRRLADLKGHEETRWFLIILGSAITIILINNFLSKTGDPTVDVIFNVVSISTSTGYATSDYNQWPLLSKEIILMLMVIGGCSGSTAGGLKVSRVLLWFRFARSELTRTFRPQMESRPRMVNSAKNVDNNTLGQLFIVLTSSCFFLVAGSLAIRLFEPDFSIMGCVSATVTSLCNNGPAFAEFGPTKNFSQLSTPSTLILPAFMILGRLGFVYALVLFSRKLWKHY